MKPIRRFTKMIQYPVTGLFCAIVSVSPVQGAVFDWTAGSNTNLNWADPLNWSGGVPTIADDAILPFVVPNPGSLLNPNVITLGTGSAANLVSFKGGYQLAGGDLTLGAGGLRASLGTQSVISSQLLGTSGLTMNGGGAIRLTNNTNAYTGVTTITNGTLIISDPGALGLDTSAIVVTGFNPVIGSTNLRGFGGGALFLDGQGAPVTFTRDLSLQGQGPIGDRSAAFMSSGDVTLSGTVTTAQPASGTFLNTRFSTTNGILKLSGALVVQGTAATTITSFGGTNQTGASNFSITGTLSGTGTVDKSGSGMLLLNPSDSSGFAGTIRASGSATGGQSSIRIVSPNVLGTRTATGTGGVIDLNTGTLEVRMDAPSLLAGGAAANVYQRNNATVFVDHGIGGSAINGVATFGQLAFEEAFTLTLNSRNGYGVTFGAAPVQGGTDNSTITNNLAGLLTFTGAFWSNTDTGGNRTMTIGGNGNTLIQGNITASNADAGENHLLTKTGSGSLTITSTGATLDGNVNVNGGAVVITDFRSVNNGVGSGTINIGTGTTAGTLIIGTSVAATAAGLTTSKTINLASTTGAVGITANQAGSNPVIINSGITASGAGAKTLTLSGTSTVDNIIQGGIVNNSGTNTTALHKVGSGTWVLGNANAKTYTGTTTISNGRLKLEGNGAASTTLPATNAVTMSASNGYAGAIFEYVGPGGASVQNLGTFNSADGANTILLTPGSGTASLTFSSLSGSVPADDSSLNVISPDANSKVTFTGLATGLVPRVFYNGSDVGYSQAGVIRAPVYGTDAGFLVAPGAATLPAGQNNFDITGDITAQGSQTTSSLRFGGSRTLTLTGGSTLTVRTAAANSDGVILATGGSSLITGGTDITTGGSGSISFRVNGASDVLTLETPIASTTTGGLTKSGAGTLVLAASNAQTGIISINEGTIKLSGVGSLGGAVDLFLRQAGVLDLNGVNSATTNALALNGIITNTSASPATFTYGGVSGNSTLWGSINQTSGTINLVKTGSGTSSLIGLSNYTGHTTIGSTGLVSADVLADIGSPSGIGAGDATDDATNAASLVFNGSTGGLAYVGAIRNNVLTLGATSASTNRLFTLSGTGATISSTAANNNSIVWSNPGAIVHGIVGPQAFVLSGTSQADNIFTPQLTDSGTGTDITSVTKTGTGIWKLNNPNNTYTGPTRITQGILIAVDGQGLPTASNLEFAGGSLYSQGALTRDIGTGPGQMQFIAPAANTAQFSGGFVGGDSKLTVDWSGTPEWGVTAGFLDTRNGLILNGSQAQAQGATGSIALSEVELAGDFSLGTVLNSGNGPGATFTIAQNSATLTVASTAGMMVGQTISGTNIPSGAYIVSINSATQITMSANTANSSGIAGTYNDGAIATNTLRPIRVDDNGNTGADFASISGIISGNAGTGIRKLGTGILRLTGANTYDGETNVNQGTLSVMSLGHSTVPGASSVGSTNNANLDSNAVTLGNVGTGAGILQYIGPGEVSNRKIRLNTTTGSTQIHADGTGPLVLENVANDMVAGAKTLFLRGSNTSGNMISSILSDNGGTLGVTVDGGATWILTNPVNNYTGTTSVGAGALGIGSDTALGVGTFSIGSGSIFAYGGDRTISNPSVQPNNSQMAVMGEHSITFTQTFGNNAGGNSPTLNNTLVAGKTLTFGGGITFNSMTANRTWTVDGGGTTIVDGNITTSTAFGTAITKNGNGVLQLNGTASNYNQNNVSTDIDRGTLRIGANNAIPSGAGFGGLILSPELAGGDTAILDLNGKTQIVNALTATTDGTVIIDNTSATPASLTFGAADATVNFGNGVGTYTIQNSGGGALSIFKTGSTTTTIPAGVTLAHTGTTGVLGGTMAVGSPLNGTTGLQVSGTGSTLTLTGGITNPSAITSVVVENGSTLNLLDGTGSQISNLTTLTLGSTAGTMSTLGMNVGDVNVAGDQLGTDLLNLLAGGSLNLFAGNQVTLNLTDAGLNAGATYNLVTSASGGLTSGNLGTLDWILGATPGGFTSITLNRTDNVISVTTGALITGNLYWRGNTNTAWNGALNNWSEDKAGTIVASTIPGQGSDVIFAADPVGGAITTTLEQNFKIRSLTFEGGATPVTSVTINPGAVPTNRLEIAPASSSNGISIPTGGPTTVTIATPLRVGADQTWNVADTGSVLSLGSLQGGADVTKTGSGRVVLTAAADPTFNPGQTADVTVSGGLFEMQNAGSLGSAANNNLANVLVTGGTFFTNSAAATTANPITLAGGTLSAGGGTQTYSAVLNVTAPSTIHMLDPVATTAAGRSITLSNGLTGSGNLTLDSINTLSGGNPITATLTLNQDNSAFTGDWNLVRGTIATNNFNGLGTGSNVNFEGGRIQFSAPVGATWDFTKNFSVSSATGNAVGEFSVSTAFTANINSPLTLGGAGGYGELRVVLSADTAAFNLNAGVILAGDGRISLGTASTRFMDIGTVISETGGPRSLRLNDEVWATTYGIIRLSAANTFTGDFAIARGVAEFTTVSNVGGPASNLGQGNTLILGGGNLRYIGSANMSTDRPISLTGSSTLAHNGATGTSVTYSGAITATGNSSLTLTGLAGNEGFLTGGINQVGDVADLTVNGGKWSISGPTSRIGDDVTVTGAGVELNIDSAMLLQARDDFTVTANATLNLGGSGVLSFSTATLSADASLRATNGGVINLGGNNSIVVTDFDGLRIGVDAGGNAGVLNMGVYNQTVNEFILGNRNLDREGVVNGTGTLTVTGNLDVYEGTIYANLASSGTTAFEKLGAETVTLFGDNSGLASTGATIVYEGNLVLDHTASNTPKIRSASQLDLRGGTLTVAGSDTAPTVTDVASLTLGSGGASYVVVNPGAGQDAVLNINGSFTRANGSQDGTVRFVLPSGVQSATRGITTTQTLNAYGLLGATNTTAFATVEDATGLWFASKSGSNIVPLVSTVNNDVTAWATGEHVTEDGAGFTGTVTSANINTLRYAASNGSTFDVSPTGALNIATGTILVTPLVDTGLARIQGGTFSSATSELLVIQESTRPLEISSVISGNHAVGKSGTGTLVLTGNNNYTDETDIHQGTLAVGGGNGIGDTSLVTLAANTNSTLQLINNETIGRLQGGRRADGGDYGVVDVGLNTLTINQSATTTYSGFFSGSGSLVMNTGSTGNLNVVNISTAFTGPVVVSGGLFQLSGVGQINASSFTINKGGNLLLDNNGTTRSGTRILDSTPIFLNSADGTFSGETRPRGLAIRTNQNATTNETIGNLNFASGNSYFAGEASGTTGISHVIASNFIRTNNATANVRGRALGLAAGDRTQLRIGDATNQTAFIATLVGGGGAAGTTTVSVVPWAVGETLTAGLADNNMGNSLVTYVSGAGFRPLTFTEYDTFASKTVNTANVREVITSDLTLLPGQTLNALVLHNDNAAASDLNVTGLGATNGLAVTSGALLFTLNPAATASVASSTTLGGFDDGITVGATNEYVITVQNPSSAANTATLTASISSPLASAADITKSGRGTLILNAASLAGGGARKTTINEGTLQISDLDQIGGDTGALVFAGGTLRIGAGFADDLSLRGISFLSGGGIINTNGNDITLLGSLGSGTGGFTKTGTGIMTLNAAATYSGGTVVNEGTLAIGAANATGTGALTVNGGATLDLGANSLTTGLVTTQGASPAINGTGTITSNAGFFLNHTGDTTISAVLAGSVGLRKAQTSNVTLNGANSFSGQVEVLGGTLSFDTIGDVGAGASSLGSPTTVANGMIRMGNATTATALNYVGAGSSSNRVVAMQGTTGSVTLNNNGTGALTYSAGVVGLMAGAKTLVLGGDSVSLASLGPVKQQAATIGVVKTGTGTWELTGVNDHTGITGINNGILRITQGQALTGNVVFGDATSVTTAGTLQVLEDSSFGGLVAQHNSISLTSVLDIAASKTATFNGQVTLGSAAADTTTQLSAVGGAVVVSNPTGTGANFLVSGGATNRAIADFSGATSLNVSLNPAGGNFQIGSTSSTNATGYGTLTLAPVTTITSAALNVGGGGSYNGNIGQVNALLLGTGTNTFNVGAFNIGTGIRDLGSVTFLAGTGTLVVRGADGTSATPFNMGTGTATTAVALNGNQNTFDVTGHSVDLKFAAVNIGTQNRAADLHSVFSFDTGTLEMASLNASSKGANASTTSTIINIGGGTVTTGAWTLSSNTGPGTATTTLNLTGGSIGFSGGITAGANTGGGTTSTTLNLSGANLDLGGNAIGSGAMPITLALTAGGLSNVSEINGGVTLTKTGTGTLILGGNNAFTGLVDVTQGAVEVAGPSGLGAITAGTNVAAGAALLFSGGFTSAAEAVTISGDGLASDGALRNVSGINTFTGNVTTLTNTRINSDAGTLVLAPASGNALAGTDLNLNVGGAGTVNIAGPVALGTGGVTVDGTGRLILSGASTYTGATLVTSGTLQVDGNITTSSGTTVNGGTLSGVGTLGPIVINTGGALAPGTDGSTGALSMASLIMNGGSVFKVDFDSDLGTTDTINIVGGLALSGTVDIAFTDLDNSPPLDFNHVLTLATYGTAWNPAHLFTYLGNPIADDSNIVIGGQTFLFNYNGGVGGNQIIMTNVSDVPPSDILLSNDSALENQAVGATVGVVSGFDSNPGQTATLTFSFGTGLGDDDNASFTLDGTTLKTTAVFDRETKATYSIRLRATDDTVPTPLFTDKVFIIDVDDINEPPTISNIADTSTDEDVTAGPIAFTVTDPENVAGLIITGSSDNPTLVPNANITFGGTPGSPEVSVAPAADQNGSATITVSIDDGLTQLSDTFVVTVNPINDMPVFTKGSDIAIPLTVDSPQTFNGWVTGINDSDPEVAQSLTFGVVVNSGAAIFDTLPAIDSSGNLTFELTGVGGTAEVAVTLMDDATAGGAALTTAAQTFNITQAASANSELSALTLSSGTLSPAFDPGTLAYTADVPNAVTSVTVTPTGGDAFSTIEVQVNGGGYAPVASGNPSGSLALNVGNNSIDVRVTAQDTVTQDVYSIVVDRAPSSNANLSALSVSPGTLSPTFAPATLTYSATVANFVTSVTVTPTVQEPNATIEVDGVAVASGSPSGAISLNPGLNTITVDVLAQDATTTQTYTLQVTRSTVVVSDQADSGIKNDLLTNALSITGTPVGPLVFTLLSGPTNGELIKANESDIEEIADGNYRYRPAAGFKGLDSFTWQVADNTGILGSATVTINVVERPPFWSWEAGSNLPKQKGTYPGTAPGPGNPGARSGAATWSDGAGNVYMFGGLGFGLATGPGALSDLWTLNLATETWTFLGGSNAIKTPGTYPATAPGAGTPGARSGATTWTDLDGNLWMFGGLGHDSTPTGNGPLNDLWKYDTGTGVWTWMGGSKFAKANGVYGTQGTPAPANTPGGRSYASGWTDTAGNLYLFGGNGMSFTGTAIGLLNDVWKYNTVSGQWTWLKGVGVLKGPALYGAKGIAANNNTPGARSAAAAWTGRDGMFYLFGGSNNNDLWRYDPASNQWVWLSGQNKAAGKGVYAKLGVPDATNEPASRGGAAAWVGEDGSLMLFGGIGAGLRDDVWSYNVQTGLWTWVKGSALASAKPIYGTLGVGSEPNTPGARQLGSVATDALGNAWHFGGVNGANSYSDLFKLDLPEEAVARTLAATGVADNDATLEGEVTPNGFETSAYFRYGKRLDLSDAVETTAVSIGDGNVAVAVDEAISALDAGTTYYYQMVAENAFSVTTGEIKAVTTTGASAATVQFAAAASTVSEGVGVANIAVTLSKPLAAPVSVAITGTGFFVGTNISFASGQTVAFVPVTITNNNVVGADVTSNLGIGTITGSATAGAQTAHLLTVEDDDEALVVTGPTSQFVAVRDTLVLSVNATQGSSPILYQWLKNGKVIKGATSASYVIHNATLAAAGIYTCNVTNPVGAATGMTPAEVFVVDATPKVIATTVGKTAKFTVAAAGPFPISYAWKKAPATTPPGVTTLNSYTTPALAEADSGIYFCEVSKTGSMTLVANGGNNHLRVAASTALNYTAAGVVGTYFSIVDRNPLVGADLGGRIDLTTTATGAFTAKLTADGVAASVKGTLVPTVVAGNITAIEGRADFVRKGKATLRLDFQLGINNNTFTGTLTEEDSNTAEAFTGYRNKWLLPKDATAYAGYYTFALELPQSVVGDLEFPQGNGFGSFTIATDGRYTCTGFTADGFAISSAGFLGPVGEVGIYTLSKARVGSLLGEGDITPDGMTGANNMFQGTLSWNKSAALATAKDQLYRNGFGATDLTIIGGKYKAPVAGGVIAGLLNVDNKARVAFDEGGITTGQIDGGVADTDMKTNTVVFTIKNTNPTKTTQTVIVPAAIVNPNKFTFKLASKPLGQFTGTFTMPNANTALVRSGKYSGMIVWDGTSYIAPGYFLLNRLPEPGQTVKTSTILSGHISLEPAP